MPDMEKVIKGLERCTSDECTCDKCDYWEHNRVEDDPNCGDVLMLDALALLKEQQAINDHLSKVTDRLNKLIDRRTEEIKWLKRKSRWIVNTKKYGEDNYHCLLCGAIVEKDEAGRHYWQRCYHCGAYMELMDGTDRDYEKDETH